MLLQVPIICICNDRQKASVRTLAKYCYDIKFAPPSTDSIKGRLRAVCAREGLAVDDAALTQLVESVGGDMRQALNTLQVRRCCCCYCSAAGLRHFRGGCRVRVPSTAASTLKLLPHVLCSSS